jgi:hypothetical protein
MIRRPSLVALMAPLALAAWGCAATTPSGLGADGKVEAVRAADGTIIDDRSLCDWKGRKDREVSETAGAGAIQPNVRRVYQVFGSGSDRRKVLVCREVDTNLDGVKDTVRRYNEEGQSKEELADTNYDGKLDTWIVFAKGRLAEVRTDHNRDGAPDEWKTYADGKLVRVKRDANFDGKPDAWEMYQKGRLVRAGVDEDRDERVDRWDHDTEWRRRLEASDRVKEEEEQKRREREARERGEKAAEGAETSSGQSTAGTTASPPKKDEGATPKKDESPKPKKKGAEPKDKSDKTSPGGTGSSSKDGG